MEKEYLTLLKFRENMYRLLSGIFIEEIDEEMLEKLLKLNFPKISQPKENWQEDINDGYRLITNYLEGYKGLSEDKIKEKLEDLAADYAKIFLSAGEASGKAAFPYESFYLGNDSQFGGSTQMELNALYLSKGLKVSEDIFKIMDDHIGLEFNFMAELLKIQQEAIASDDDNGAKEAFKEQRNFYKKHLSNWTATFLNDVYKYADRDFYKGIARFATGFLASEEVILKDKELNK